MSGNAPETGLVITENVQQIILGSVNMQLLSIFTPTTCIHLTEHNYNKDAYYNKEIYYNNMTTPLNMFSNYVYHDQDKKTSEARQ